MGRFRSGKSRGRYLELTGDKELFARLDMLAVELRDDIAREALLDGGEIVADVARSKAPVKSGTLRGSIDTEAKRDKRGWVVAVGPGPETEVTESGKRKRKISYGLFPEFGVGGASHKPWLRPALDATKKRATEKIKATLWRLIQRHAK